VKYFCKECDRKTEFPIFENGVDEDGYWETYSCEYCFEEVSKIDN